jgi:hypothetical protein
MKQKHNSDITQKGETPTMAKSTKNTWRQHLRRLGKLIPPLPLIMQLGISLPLIPRHIPPQLTPGCREERWYFKTPGGFEAGRVSRFCPGAEPSNEN